MGREAATVKTDDVNNNDVEDNIISTVYKLLDIITLSYSAVKFYELKKITIT